MATKKKRGRPSKSVLGQSTASTEETKVGWVNPDLEENTVEKVLESIKEEPVVEEIVVEEEVVAEEPVVEEEVVVEEPVAPEQPLEVEEEIVSEAPAKKTVADLNASELKFYQRTGVIPQ